MLECRSRGRLQVYSQNAWCIRRRHYSYRTEKYYLFWVRQFLRYHARRHPRQMGAPTRVSAFERRELTESTQTRPLRFPKADSRVTGKPSLNDTLDRAF